MAALDTAIAAPAAVATTPRRRRRKPALSVFQWITLIVISIFVLVPLYTTLLGGFKEIGELRVNPFGFPASWDPIRFTEILTGSKYFTSMGSSLLIAVGTVLLSILLSSMTAFAFAHIKFFGSKYVLGYLMLGLLFPSATGILPLFIKMRDLGMLDSHWGIIIVQAAFSISFSVLLFYNFFKELPKELVDAARMDNCGYIRIYWYVTLPLCLPIIATVGVFNFVGSWNSFLLPLIVLNTDAKYTWPLGIMQYQGQYGSDWPRILAYLTLSLLPAVIAFLAAQRFIISGLTGGAVKG
jgi:raffinose/stachyose/melibiose transport system permease protein